MCPPVLPSTTTFYFLAYYNFHCRLLFFCFPETGTRIQQAEAPPSESVQPQNDFNGADRWSSSPAATPPPSETAHSLNGHLPQAAAPQHFPAPSSMRLRCGYATDSFNAEEYRQDTNTVRWLQFSSGQETEAGYTGHLYSRYFMWEVMWLIEIETRQRSALFASRSVLSCSDNLQYNKEPMVSHSHVQW